MMQNRYFQGTDFCAWIRDGKIEEAWYLTGKTGTKWKKHSKPNLTVQQCIEYGQEIDRFKYFDMVSIGDRKTLFAKFDVVVNKIIANMSKYNYELKGHCYEAALAAGIKLAYNRDMNVRLIKGKVRGITHWWVEVDGMIVDPTIDQFENIQVEEYKEIKKDGIDLYELAMILKN